MARFESPVRDLARQLSDVARKHAAYSQVWEFVNHMNEHLSAIARCEEVNREQMEREKCETSSPTVDHH